MQRSGLIHIRRTAALRGRKISYVMRTSSRARRPNISVYPDGGVVVTVPQSGTVRDAEAILRRKASWLLDRLRECRAFRGKRVPSAGRGHYLRHRERARKIIAARLAHFNEYYRFPYRTVRIKNLVTQWGSCSDAKNLNFNYRLIFLPPRLRDYVIVHELCHLGILNHSPNFWRLVEEMFPNYEFLERELGRYVLVRF